MIRCYMGVDKAVGFGHQLIKALVPPPPKAPIHRRPSRAPASCMGPKRLGSRPLRAKMETEWTPQTMATLGIDTASLPIIWDADFLDGVTIKPALALGGWVAFKPMHGEAVVMGDVVLLDSEITPVLTKLTNNGLEITAVHNHLLRANPPTYYSHLGGHGDPVALATAIHAALAESKTPLTPPAAAAPPPAIDLDTAQLDQIIGIKGRAADGVYQFGVPRRDPVTMHGTGLTPPRPLGLATGINFQPMTEGKAAITGDFVLTADEVNPVIQALRAGGIEVTALHSHMLDEQPRLFFMHFWANDDAIKLAKGLRAALDKMANTKS